MSKLVVADSPVIWTPADGPQTAFLSCPYFEVFYGGAAGGGKSDCLLVDALSQVHNSAYRALLLRRTFPELRELIDRSRSLYPRITHGKARYRGDERVWTFPSGARIEFGYLNHEDDKQRYQGQQYSWVGWDELTHFEERAYFWVLSRIRAPEGSGLVSYVRATSNPGGRGHGWVKSRFVDPAPEGNTPLYDPVTGTTRIYIPSRLRDNPHLFKTDYGKRLLALPEADRKALLDGDWNAYEGSVFTLVPGIHRISWREFMERHGTDRPGLIPDGWRRFRTMDWGLARPYACHWYAVDYEGTAYVYRERYGVKTEADGKFKPDVGNRLEPSKVGEMIAAVEADEDEAIALGWTGPDLFTSGRADVSAGIKIYEHFLKHGVVFTPWTAGPGSRRAKKAAFHERLYYEKHPETGEIITAPGIVFIEEECPHAIRTIQSLEYDQALGGEDVDSTGEDHCLTGDTLVHTASGAIAISDIVGTSGWLLSWDGEQPVWRPYADCRKTQSGAVVYEVVFEDGRHVKGTASHRFLMEDGSWAELGSLTPGQRVRDAGPRGKIPLEVSAYDCECGQRHDPGVQREALLPVRELLPAQGGKAPSSCLGGDKRGGPNWVARPPFGSQQAQQQLREPRVVTTGGPSVPPRQHAGKAGGQAGAHAQDYDPESSGVAPVGRGQEVAFRERQGFGGEVGARGSCLRGLHGVIPVSEEDDKVLLCEVRRHSQEASQGNPAANSGEQEGCRPEGEGAATVKSVKRLLERADVYNLEVAGTHCFAVNGGLVVHNCYDSVSGFCLMRPWAPKRRPTGLDAMFPRRGHGEGGSTWLSR